MTSDMSPTERLSRHKNVTLQRQLQVTLAILDKEKRSVQHDAEKLICQYHHFLLDISNRWTALDDYKQPDTRAIKKNGRTKDRQMSTVSLSENATQNVPSTPTSRNNARKSAVDASPLAMTRGSSANWKQLKFATCIEVLDDIIQNHHTKKKKTTRCRKIGLALPMDTHSEAPSESTSSTKEKQNSNFRPEDRRCSIRIRPSSSYIRTPERVRSGADVVSVRPQTAQPRLSWQRDAAERLSSTTPGGESSSYRRRPRTAPRKYELYGRSPAVSRQTVAGIMAEMKTRCIATRKMIGQSKQLHDYVVSLS